MCSMTEMKKKRGVKKARGTEGATNISFPLEKATGLSQSNGKQTKLATCRLFRGSLAGAWRRFPKTPQKPMEN